MRKLLILALITCITISLATACGGGAPSEAPISPPPTEKTAPPVEPIPKYILEPPPPPPSQLSPSLTFEPIVITGTGDKTSPPFFVTTNEWVVNWNYTPNPKYPEMAVFGFFVYPRGETAMSVVSVMAGMGGKTIGSTYSYAGVGEYYIKVLAGNIDFWTILITPP